MGFCYYFASRRYLYRPWNDIDAQTTTGSARRSRGHRNPYQRKLPGRIDTFLVQEGDWVRQGDTLVVINSPEVHAKFQQVNALEQVAVLQNKKLMPAPDDRL